MSMSVGVSGGAYKTRLPRLQIVCAAVGLCAIAPCNNAIAEGNNQFSITNKSVYFQSQLETDAAKAMSPLGMELGYAYRSGFFTSLFANYGAVIGAQKILLHGFSGGIDYALLGGQSTTEQLSGHTLYKFAFPYRLGVSLAATMQTYNLGEVTTKQTISYKKVLPSEGSLIGTEIGTSLEIPLSESSVFVTKATYIAPIFTSESKQKGMLMCLNLGLGILL
jgi:hypothetical protein